MLRSCGITGAGKFGELWLQARLNPFRRPGALRTGQRVCGARDHLQPLSFPPGHLREMNNLPGLGQGSCHTTRARPELRQKRVLQTRRDAHAGPTKRNSAVSTCLVCGFDSACVLGSIHQESASRAAIIGLLQNEARTSASVCELSAILS
jgi:hypothetical protein